jgi:hypothetical protein
MLTTSASATPRVSVNWGSCPLPAGNNRNMGVASRTRSRDREGIERPCSRVQVFLILGTRAVSGCLRYDDAGCEAGRASLENASASDPCPPRWAQSTAHQCDPV